MLVTVLAALGSGVTAATTPSACGSYSGCSLTYGPVPGQSYSLQDNITLSGYLGGTLVRSVQVFPVTWSPEACTVSSNGSILKWEVPFGSWLDLGPLDGDANTRKITMTYTGGIQVTPLTQEGIALLEQPDNCPCNSSSTSFWQVGRPQQLTCPSGTPGSTPCPVECPPGTCLTTIFGGTTQNENNEGEYPGYTIQQPAFGTMHVDADATNNVTFSRLDADPSDGFNVTVNPYDEFSNVSVVAGMACNSSVQADTCGTYGGPITCRPYILDGLPQGSIMETFSYRGPAGYVDLGCTTGASAPCPTAYGVYNRTASVYLDDNCSSAPDLTYSEQGSMANLNAFVFGSAAVPGGPVAYGRVPQTITITPMSLTKALTLQNHCPCTISNSANSWAQGAPRVVTTCPPETCNVSSLWWYEGAGFGVPAYAAGTMNQTQIGTSDPVNWFSFSAWNDSYTSVASLPLEETMTMSDTACGNSANSDNFCGVFTSYCFAQLNLSSHNIQTTYGQDSTENYFIGGFPTPDGDGISAGTITLTKTLYNNVGSALPCAGTNTSLNVVANGYYSAQDIPAGTPGSAVGYQQAQIQYSSLIVTPVTSNWTNILQQACPCGNSAAWQTGIARTIASCGAMNGQTRPCEDLFASGVFPGGALNTPGYVTMQNTQGQLRISPAALTAQDGPNEVMTGTTPIVPRQFGCTTPQRSDSLCGQWNLPCHSIADSGNNYASMATVMFTGAAESCAECFWMNTTYFTDQTGCEDNSPSYYINVEQNGFYGIQGPATSGAVREGNNLVMTSQWFVVTPLSQQAVQVLNQLCSCPSQPGTWALGIGRTFNGSCLPSECQNVPPLRQQIGAETQYGAFQHLGTNLRFTKFAPSTQQGADVWRAANLTVTDYQFVQNSSECNQVLPVAPYGPNPHPSPQRSPGGSKGMSGGDVFILILFLTIVVYFGGGMAYNFQRTGGFKNGGVPVIPHVGFWRGIPALVAEGCHFTFAERCGLGGGGGRGAVYSTFGGGMDPDTGNRADVGSPGGYGAL